MKGTFLFLVFSLNIFGQVFYNYGKVSLVYNSWTNACTNEILQKPIFLKKRGTYQDNWFCSQILQNPDVIVKPNGEFYIYSYGDHDMETQEGAKLGDEIYLQIRKLSGNYDLEMGCSGEIKPILSFYPDNYGDDPKKWNWSKVGGMGQGMAVFYSPIPDLCGHKYFGIVPVWDKGDRECEEEESFCYEERLNDDRAFLAWAVSSNGINWKFLNDLRIGPYECSDWETDNPKYAFPFIHRDCFQMTGYDQTSPFGREVFHHVSLFYSDPSKYLCMGKLG